MGTVRHCPNQYTIVQYSNKEKNNLKPPLLLTQSPKPQIEQRNLKKTFCLLYANYYRKYQDVYLLQLKIKKVVIMYCLCKLSNNATLSMEQTNTKTKKKYSVIELKQAHNNKLTINIDFTLKTQTRERAMNGFSIFISTIARLQCNSWLSRLVYNLHSQSSSASPPHRKKRPFVIQSPSRYMRRQV